MTLLLEARAQTPPVVSGKHVAASKGWTAPKTPWGDPDLQGIWTSDDCIGTPMQRPANIGERLYLTELEIEERETQLARQTENDKQEFLAADTRAGAGPPTPLWRTSTTACRAPIPPRQATWRSASRSTW